MTVEDAPRGSKEFARQLLGLTSGDKAPSGRGLGAGPVEDVKSQKAGGLGFRSPTRKSAGFNLGGPLASKSITLGASAKLSPFAAAKEVRVVACAVAKHFAVHDVIELLYLLQCPQSRYLSAHLCEEQRVIQVAHGGL